MLGCDSNVHVARKSIVPARGVEDGSALLYPQHLVMVETRSGIDLVRMLVLNNPTCLEV